MLSLEIHILVLKGGEKISSLTENNHLRAEKFLSAITNFAFLFFHVALLL